MAIIVEGVDNTGKSTLARMLARRLDFTLMESEGPPRYKGEINLRVERYLRNSPRTVYARHPCVSQPIYAVIRNDPPDMTIDHQLVIEFYDQKHILVYCHDSNRGLETHVHKEHDKPEHLAAITNHYDELCYQYRTWALNHAHLNYRIGDSMDRIVRACAAMVQP